MKIYTLLLALVCHDALPRATSADAAAALSLDCIAQAYLVSVYSSETRNKAIFRPAWAINLTVRVSSYANNSVVVVVVVVVVV